MSNGQGILDNFELKLVVIAILLPIFLESFPPIIEKIAFPPFKLILPLLISYGLGFLWFIVLLIGLLNLGKSIEPDKRGKSYMFEFLFGSVTYITIIAVGWVASIYLYVLLEKIIPSLDTITFSLAVILLALMIFIVWLLYRSLIRRGD